MRVETNEELVSRNKKFATYLFIFSLVVLVLGFFAANGDAFGVELLDPSLYVIIMPILLVVGLVCTVISVRMTNLWIRQPRPEEAIPAGLKGLSNKSVLYNYLHLPARHVLICPQGIFAMITRFQDGRIVVNGDEWQTKRSIFSAIFSVFRMDGVGNPMTEATAAAKHLQDYVDTINPDIKVHPLIIFVDPRVQLEVEDATMPILHTDPKATNSLKDFMRSFPKEDYQTMTAEEITAFEEATIDFEYEDE